MKHVIGIDLGTSAVKILLVNQDGNVVQEVSKPYSLIQEKVGYSEQNPQDWVDQTVAGLSDLLMNFNGDPESIEGISFSGQMHGLVLLDEHNDVLRHAILWNDTRTTEQCQQIYDVVGEERLLEITKNPEIGRASCRERVKVYEVGAGLNKSADTADKKQSTAHDLAHQD